MKNFISSTVAILLFGGHQFASAATLDISNVPLYLGGAVEPNIMFTLDDSGSMQFEVMPDENRYLAYYLFPRPSNLYGAGVYTNRIPNFDDDNVHNFFLRSSANNSVFYNPDIEYVPWSNADGSSMPDANPNAAYYNPADTSRGSMNLVAQQSQYACWYRDTNLDNSATGDPCYGNHSFWPITYYVYDGTGDREDRSNYTRIRITSSTPSGTTYPNNSGDPARTRDEEIQNFANWFQYYRSRVLMARAGVGQAFAKQGTNLRVGFAAINQGGRTVDGVYSSRAVIDGVRKFSGTSRSGFFDRLYDHTIDANGTPLRSAAREVGEYFERSDNRGPWGNSPGTNDTSDHLVCRQSYHILTTDGYWNGSNPGVGNSDNTAGSVITGPNDDDYQYTPTPPYSDSYSNTLADVAMDYWKRDLRPNLSNEVTKNQQDPAFWQHLVTFTVGLGVTGTLDPTSDLDDLTDGSINWPQPGDDKEENIDDMWHAAVNSRGQFFSASEPEQFSDSLSAILNNITSRTSSAASVALNSGSVSSDTRIYQARFKSGDWSGQLLAYEIDSDALIANLDWDASTLIPRPGQRIISTYDGSTGQRFRWGRLTATQQAQLGSREVLSYIRGNAREEIRNGGSFRNRNTRLGDIINSTPTYVAKPNASYPNYWGPSQPENDVPYSSFVTANANRQPLIYVGANDGMMHAFNASTGVEEFAYIPNIIFDKLQSLSSTNYNHEYFVDGSPTIFDAFFSDDEWHTVLVSGLGAGGQGIFALDVTDPTAFDDQDGAASKVLWEFSDADDRDMGLTFGQPSIIRLNNGEWAALFSGGYNNNDDNNLDGNNATDSITGNGVMYLVNIETGALIKKFDTLIGTADDPTGNNRPNGLSTPTAVDVNNDRIVDLIYAGDLFGNVWSIDVSSSDKANWDFSYKSGANPRPLYTACNGTTCNGSNVQPITTQIQVVSHPSEKGYLLLFGTGKYFEVGDNSATGQVTQSFYSIWDKRLNSLTAFNRSNLLQQEIVAEVNSNNDDYRISSNYAIDWSSKNGWYIDLYNTQGGNSNNYGERQVSNAIIRNGRVIFVTLVPSDDPCDDGGSGWLMEVNYASGSRLSYSPFDLNGDQSFTPGDFLNVGDIDGDGEDDYVPVSGKKSKVGIIARPSIASEAGGQREFKYTSGADGNVEVTVENPGPGFVGRQSWRQLDY